MADPIQTLITNIPYLVLAVVILIGAWIALRLARRVFVRIREWKWAPEIVNVLELVVKYVIILVAASAVTLEFAVSFGYSEALARVASGWFSYLLVALAAFIGALILLRLVRYLFVRIRERKIAPEVVNPLEIVVKYAIILVAAWIVMLQVATVLGYSEIIVGTVGGWVSYLAVAAVVILGAWIALRLVGHVFVRIRERKIAPEVVNPLEIVVKYAIILVAASVVVLEVAIAFGYSEFLTGAVGGWFTENLGRMLFIALALVFVWIFVRFLAVFFADLRRRTRFQPEVIDLAATAAKYLVYGIVGILVIMTVLTMMGIETIAQSLVTIFAVLFGLVVSFAATSTIGNAIAGFILMSWRPFAQGDRVDIGGGTYGDIMDLDVLFTKVRTINNELVSVPNLIVLGNKIINYSGLERCIVHQEVSVGYDYARKVVEGLLLKAASMTDGLLQEPKAFVLMRKLGDFSAVYEVKAYTDRPNMLATIYSELMKNIVDVFDQAGVELLNPQYFAGYIGSEGARVFPRRKRSDTTQAGKQ
jgi:small-conductance mechanosensitive channel